MKSVGWLLASAELHLAHAGNKRCQSRLPKVWQPKRSLITTRTSKNYQWGMKRQPNSHWFQYKHDYSPFSGRSAPAPLHHSSQLLPWRGEKVVNQKMNAKQTAGWITFRIDGGVWLQRFWLTWTTRGWQWALEGNVKLKAGRGPPVPSPTTLQASRFLCCGSVELCHWDKFDDLSFCRWHASV